MVFLVDDVDEQARRLADLGVRVLSPPADRPWGHRTVHVADPDGFVVEFAQEIPRRRSRRPA
jgi:lactoylglutathione lyase